MSNRPVKLLGKTYPLHLLITAAMSAYAVILAAIFRTPDRIVCVFAMLQSSLGDIILMNYKPVTDKLPFKGFVAGGISFGLSHILYITAFSILLCLRGAFCPNAATIAGAAVWIFWTCFFLIAVLCPEEKRQTFRKRNAVPDPVACKEKEEKKNKALLFPMLGYLFFICLNLTTTLTAAASLGGIRIVSAAGMILFLGSDLVIFFDRLLGEVPPRQDLCIWIPYVLGQLLLITGA